MSMPVSPVAEFAALARHRMLARHYSDAPTHTPDRVQRILKAAVGSASLADISDYQFLVGQFSEALRTRSVFFRMYADGAFTKAPARTRLGIASGISGAGVDEGAAIPVSKITLATNTMLELRKAAALTVLTKELAENLGPNSQSLLSKELQNTTASATDSVFLAAVLSTDTGSIIPASGTDAAAAAEDLRNALLQIDLHANAKLYWCCRPTTAVKISTLASQGNFVNPAASPLGGELLGLPLLVSDGVAANELHLIDASQIAADLSTIDLMASQQGDVLMVDGVPPMNGTVPTAAQLVSLFQTNSVGLRSIVYFACERLRPNSTATITGIDWGLVV